MVYIPVYGVTSPEKNDTKNQASTLSHKMCPIHSLIKSTEPKWLIFVSFFSGEVTSYTGIPVLHPHALWKVCLEIQMHVDLCCHPVVIERNHGIGRRVKDLSDVSLCHIFVYC